MNYEITEYSAEHEEGITRCFTYLQNTEAALEADRLQSSLGLALKYLAFLQAQCRSHEGALLVALSNKSVAGFVAVWRESDGENMITSLHSFAYISDIVVLPEYQRTGIATALMMAAEKHAKSLGVSHCKVGALAHNTGAIELYRRCGFRSYEVTLLKEL